MVDKFAKIARRSSVQTDDESEVSDLLRRTRDEERARCTAILQMRLNVLNNGMNDKKSREARICRELIALQDEINTRGHFECLRDREA